MNNNKILIMLLGIGITLYYLVSYLASKSPFDMFFITLGIAAIIFGFYTEDKKIKATNGYFVAAFSINIIQWLILIYTFYYKLDYSRNEYIIPILGALWLTLYLANQIRKKYVKSSEANVNMLKDKTKLILLSGGVIIIIGSLADLIAYYYPLFLYGITLGLMVFIYGYYHEEEKVNISKRRDLAYTIFKNINFSIKYVRTMILLLILQWIILIYFIHQSSPEDWALAMTLSLNIAIFLSIQMWKGDLKIYEVLKVPYIDNITISNEKKEAIIGIGAIIIFIAFFGALALK